MPTCIERKLILTGGTQEFVCDLLRFSEQFGILNYIVDRRYTVGRYLLEPGDRTIALYWNDRPYTLYAWRLQRIARKLYYFNIADNISLSPHVFVWRDLIVDILIDDSGNLNVLDTKDLPSDLDPVLRIFIEQAEKHIIAHHPTIIREVDGIVDRMAFA
jgi:predicted RNA-binding protein associated with RNAse of E/G family